MPTIAGHIYTRLATDPALVGTLGVSGYSGILQGGLWDRPLKRDGPGVTEEAFYNTDYGKMNRPAGVVLDFGDMPHFQRDAVPSAFIEFPRIYLYAPATTSGKASLVAARARIYALLNDWSFATDNGPIAFVKYTDRSGITDSEEFAGAVTEYCRYDVTSRIANEV